MKKLVFLLLLSCCFANADEVYKWKDENGTVHFGDRAAAPSVSNKIDVKVRQPDLAPPAVDATPKYPQVMSTPTHSLPQLPKIEPNKHSVPADPAKVGPKCQGLVDQIAKVPRGTPWISLSEEFNRTCPGIAYECLNFKRHPENNKCSWIERSGGTVLSTKIFE